MLIGFRCYCFQKTDNWPQTVCGHNFQPNFCRFVPNVESTSKTLFACLDKSHRYCIAASSAETAMIHPIVQFSSANWDGRIRCSSKMFICDFHEIFISKHYLNKFDLNVFNWLLSQSDTKFSGCCWHWTRLSKTNLSDVQKRLLKKLAIWKYLSDIKQQYGESCSIKKSEALGVDPGSYGVYCPRQLERDSNRKENKVIMQILIEIQI